MSKKFLLWLSILLFFVVPANHVFAAYPSVESYEDKRIAKIEVIIENAPPEYSFDQKTVLSRLKTKTGDPFYQSTFDSDLKTLSDEYDRVEPYMEVVNGEVYITLKLWPRPKISIIKWHGNKNISTKTLKNQLDIKPQSVFNRQTFNKAFNKVKEYYLKKGYFESQLQYSVAIDTKTNEVAITIDVKEGRSGKIDDIIFSGFSNDEKSELLQMIYTKKYNLFLSWLTGSGTFNEEGLDQDRLTVVSFLQNKGYADARVEILIQEAASGKRIRLEVIADKGQVYHFGQISFSGNKLFSDSEIENLFLIHPDEIYSPDKLRDTSQSIKDLYGRKGYIDTTVDYESKVVEDQPIYNIHFQIEEGQQYKIGMIHVVGNRTTNAGVILHESLLVPGETFDTLKLKRTQSRLENIGYFKTVNVFAVRTQDDQSLGENYRDVFIEVQETHTGNLSFFGGFSTADQLFGGLDLAENNFNIKGIPYIFKKGISAIRGGGEYAHLRFSFGSKQRTYSFSWMTPYLRDTLWRLGFEINDTHSQLQSKDFDIDSVGFSTYAAYPIAPLWSFGIKYRIKNSIIHKDHDLTEKERRELGQSGLISAIGLQLNFDSTDSTLKPHNGFRSNIETEYAGLGGISSFLRFGYLNTYYTPLWNRGIMKYRFDFRFILPLFQTNTPDEIPVSERFFLGGETTVRGYRTFDLGPHFEDGTPKGGISSSLLSVEYLHEVFSFLDAFIFADAGGVTLKRFNPGHFKLSYGAGVRLSVMSQIPITLGMGFPVNASGHSEVQKFFFSMGGQF